MSIIEQFEQIVGAAHCLTNTTDMQAYLTEQRGLFHGQAIAVLRPKDTQQLAELVRLCADSKIDVIPQGGNTGLCGGAIPLKRAQAVVIRLDRLNQIVDIDHANMTIEVGAGCILAKVKEAAEAADCFFPLSLAAQGSCQIGGNIATNAGGVNVLHYGSMRDLVLGLEVVLPDGRVWNGLRALRKDNSGYDLKQFFIGSEGTLGIITAAILKLFPKPKAKLTALLALADIENVPDIIYRLRSIGVGDLTACEVIPRIALDLDQEYITGMRDPFARAYPWYMLVEFSLLSSLLPLSVIEEELASLVPDLCVDIIVAQTDGQSEALWALRENIPEAQKRDGGSIKHDIAVSTSQIPQLIKRLTRLVELEMPGIRTVAFGHLGDGNVHFNLSYPKYMVPEAFLTHWERFNRLVHDVVQQMNGSIAAEHGIGWLKVDELKRLKPDLDIELMRRIKAAFDPHQVMNPGKIIG